MGLKKQYSATVTSCEVPHIEGCGLDNIMDRMRNLSIAHGWCQLHNGHRQLGLPSQNRNNIGK